METNQLNDTLVTALHALKILAGRPRTMRPDGTVTITLNQELLSNTYNAYVEDALYLIRNTPELLALLEIRVLQMQTQSAMNRLKNITGG